MPILTEEERVGTLLAGRYRLDAILGRGGTGVVYSATHNWTGRRVAVKLLRPEHSRDLTLTRRFLQEARAAANIAHPNVVQVLDMGNENDGTVHLVLEMLDGTSLGKLLEDRRALSIEETLSILVPIMDALVVAHRQGIIHRDLKPDNVFLHADGSGRRVPKLLDFGTAKMMDGAWGSATQTGTLVGTPFYMSPEQAEGRKDQGPQTDVWSMGVILYRCLSGALPFYADSPTKLLIEIVKATAKPLAERAGHVPEGFSRIVDRALAPEPERRWPTIEAMLHALRDAAKEADVPFPALPDPEGVEPPPAFDPGPTAEPPRGRRSMRIVIWSGAALAALSIGTVAASLGDPEASRASEADDRVDAASAPIDSPVRAAGGVAEQAGPRAPVAPEPPPMPPRAADEPAPAPASMEETPDDAPGKLSPRAAREAARTRAAEDDRERAEESTETDAQMRLPSVTREW